MSMLLALIDDDSLYRQGMRKLLSSLDANIQIEEFSKVPSPFAKAEAPDAFGHNLVILDYHIPNCQFVHNLRAVRACFGMAKIVVVSADDDAHHIIQAIDHGAAGFIPKSSNADILVAALRLVLLGQTYLPVEVIGLAPHGPAVLRQAFESLSDAQQRVLLAVVAGKSNKLIAIEHGLALGTIKSHLSAAYKGLGLKNRTEAVMALSALALGDTRQ
jgi:DNA-binding NarL/FixJ family response regulator